MVALGLEISGLGTCKKKIDYSNPFFYAPDYKKQIDKSVDL